MKTAYGYIRYSTDKQGDMSVEAQTKVITDLYQSHVKADFKDLVLLVDQDCSARQKEFETRPKGKELCLRVGRGDCIIFSKLDRGFRNIKDMLVMFDRWDKRGIRVFCPDFGLGCHYDSSSLVGKIMIVCLGLCAEIEGHRSSQRMADWEASQRAQGRATGGNPPKGFKFVRWGPPTGSKKQPAAYLQPEDSEQELMRFIWQHKKQGVGHLRIYKHLVREGITTFRGRKLTRLTVVSLYKAISVIVAHEQATAARRGRKLAAHEFVTPDGVICKRFDRLPKENADGTPSEGEADPLQRPDGAGDSGRAEDADKTGDEGPA